MGKAVAVDSLGSIYFTGYSNGDIGDGFSGNNDIFLHKYDSAGGEKWTRRLGTSANDTPESIAVDGADNVFIVGSTYGNLANSPVGGNDPFLLKYDQSGNLQWSRQFGSSSNERGLDVTIDGQGNAFVSGITEGIIDGVNVGGGDAFLVKFDNNGNELWSRQYGTSGYDFGEGIATDQEGNVYVTGNSNYGYPITDIDTLLVKYDPSGTHLWTREINPAGHFVGSSDIAVVDDTVYIIGEDLVSRGNWDAFLAAYDTAGNSQSYFRWGSSGPRYSMDDLASDLAVDSSGGILVIGNTEGDLAAENLGSNDIFVSKFDASGALSWSKQLGSRGGDYGNGIAVDSFGNIYVGGATTGVLGEFSAGYFDVYLLKLSAIPEPSSLVLTAMAACGVLLGRRQFA